MERQSHGFARAPVLKFLAAQVEEQALRIADASLGELLLAPRADREGVKIRWKSTVKCTPHRLMLPTTLQDLTNGKA